MRVGILDYGGTVKEIFAPDRNGDLANVSLGFDNLKDYREKSPYFGCITGRYANRIALGKFTLDGVEYSLAPIIAQIIYMEESVVLINMFGIPEYLKLVPELNLQEQVQTAKRGILGI